MAAHRYIQSSQFDVVHFQGWRGAGFIPAQAKNAGLAHGDRVLIDTLHAHALVKQIVGISSGAAVNGSKGWGAYALSKAGLNMLLSIYAKELPEIHFTALAPGVIRTPMVEHIIEEVDDTLFPSAKRLKENPIQTAEEAAKTLIATFPQLLNYESGSFLDVRTMDS